MASDLQPRVLLVGAPDERSRSISRRLIARGLPTAQIPLDGPTPECSAAAGQLALLILGQDAARQQAAHISRMLEKLRAEAVTTFVWGGGDNAAAWTGPGIESISADISLDEIVGRLTTLATYAPLVRCLDEELQHMKRLGKQLNRYIGELDKDMRLAGRLQRDFMPRRLEDIAPLKFDALFRPAVTVSGDIFDVIHIDDGHVGMFIADAMGHGTAAGLITMFLRKTLVTREIQGDSYRIIGPAEAMASMHEGMASHDLPNSNFVTAAYAVVNLATLELTVARGGHPYPLHIRPGGEITELRAEGGLMGLADIEPEFQELTVRLKPGDKVVFYTDGLENQFIEARERVEAPPRFTPLLKKWAPLGVHRFIAAIGDFLDGQEGSLHPDDDSTVLALEVAG